MLVGGTARVIDEEEVSPPVLRTDARESLPRSDCSEHARRPEDELSVDEDVGPTAVSRSVSSTGGAPLMTARAGLSRVERATETDRRRG